MGWSTVHVAYSRPDAEVVGAILRGHGIEVFVSSDDAGTMGPELAFSNGVQVRVRDEDLAMASELLNAEGPGSAQGG